jgi:hypothetical protein
MGKINAKIRNCHLFAEQINAAPPPIDITVPNISAGSIGEPTKYAENAIRIVSQIAFEGLLADMNKMIAQRRQTAREAINAVRLSLQRIMGKRAEDASAVKNMQATVKIGNLSGESKSLALSELFSRLFIARPPFLNVVFCLWANFPQYYILTLYHISAFL